MNGGIYQIRNTVNNKLYIGQTKSFTNRKRSHFKELQKGTHYNKYLQRSFAKYGEQCFVFEILEFCEKEKMNVQERFWINELETEYSSKGYNASYAVEVFDGYDKKKKINISKRVIPKVLFTDEVKAKSKLGVQNYWKLATDDIRKKHSLAKATINLELVKILKNKLAFDINLSIKDISNQLEIDENIVTHTAYLKSYKLISKELNELIINRVDRYEKGLERNMLRMWCEGYSTSNIGKKLNLDTRTIIRRLKKIRTEHHDRCRLNVINSVERKRFSQVKTCKAMSYKMLEVHLKLGYSRDYIRGVWDEPTAKIYYSTASTRGINRIFKVKNLV